MVKTRMRQHFGNALYEDWRNDTPELRAALAILRAAHTARLRDKSPLDSSDRGLDPRDYANGRAYEMLYAAAYHLRHPEAVDA